MRFANIFYPVCILPLVILGICQGQPEAKYDPFDWILYRQSGIITSISEGYSYIYIGTSEGGIFRYNIYGNGLEESLTVAQGLPDNRIESLHFDYQTGYLWAATPNYICFSYNRTGGWYQIEKSIIGIPDGIPIEQIGSSSQNIWLKWGAMFSKLAPTSGIHLGSMPSPDESGIEWSSGRFPTGVTLPDELMDYSIGAGWMMLPDRFIDDNGRDVDLSTIYRRKNGDIWIGTKSGFVLTGDRTMEIFTPEPLGIANTNVTAIVGHSPFYLAGRFTRQTKGITYFDPDRNIIQWEEFEVNINMPAMNLFCGQDTGDELWFGGESEYLIFNKKRDYWRTIGSFSHQYARCMASDSGTIWIGGDGGVERYDALGKTRFPSEIESAFEMLIVHSIEIIGSEIWFGTSNGLFIYDRTANRLTDGNQWSGNREEQVFLNCWDIDPHREITYIVSTTGVYGCDRSNHTITLIADASLYQNRPVRVLKIYENTIFLGTDRGLFRFRLDGSGYSHYKYPFVRQVNDLYISAQDCWIATDQGLVWFNWRIDS